MKERPYIPIDKSRGFTATSDNIDEIWLSIEASVLMYNNIAEQVNAGLLEYDVEAWASLYDQIVAGLDEYQIHGFVATEMIVGAGKNEDDWLSKFLDAKLETYT